MNIMKQIQFKRLTRFAFVVPVILLALISSQGHGDNRAQFTSGFIAAVGIEVDEKGHPMLAEYDSDGYVVSDVGYLGLGPLEDVSIYPAASWRARRVARLGMSCGFPAPTMT